MWALVTIVSDEWLIWIKGCGEGHTPDLSALLEPRKSFQQKLSSLEQSLVKAIAMNLWSLIFRGAESGETGSPALLLVGGYREGPHEVGQGFVFTFQFLCESHVF